MESAIPLFLHISLPLIGGVILLYLVWKRTKKDTPLYTVGILFGLAAFGYGLYQYFNLIR